MPPLLTTHEVAERLRVSPGTVRTLIRAGEIEAVRVGRQIRVSEAA
ncbi:MAG: helix-turn-helix domain-containing protein, partial [Clostridia bacterium]